MTVSIGQSHQARRSSRSTSASGKRVRIGRAGLPPTIVYGATSAVTTERVDTIAPSPIVTPGITSDS